MKEDILTTDFLEKIVDAGAIPYASTISSIASYTFEDYIHPNGKNRVTICTSSEYTPKQTAIKHLEGLGLIALVIQGLFD
jgi:hypothetical protein